jgi:inorganic pyrophosphatase
MGIKQYLGKIIGVVIDRPLGSTHPKQGFIYGVNYGYVPGTLSPDGEELDAYVLGVAKPSKKFSGKCIAIIHRTNDNDDKLVIVPEGKDFSDEEIEKLVMFQEKWFKHKVIR